MNTRTYCKHIKIQDNILLSIGEQFPGLCGVGERGGEREGGRERERGGEREGGREGGRGFITLAFAYIERGGYSLPQR